MTGRGDLDSFPGLRLFFTHFTRWRLNGGPYTLSSSLSLILSVFVSLAIWLTLSSSHSLWVSIFSLSLSSVLSVFFSLSSLLSLSFFSLSLSRHFPCLYVSSLSPSCLYVSSPSPSLPLCFFFPPLSPSLPLCHFSFSPPLSLCFFSLSLSLCVFLCPFVPLFISLSYVNISFLIPLSICLLLPLSLAAFFVGQGMASSFAPFLALPLPGNSNWKGRFNTIGPLNKVSCLKKVNNILNIKSSSTKLVSTRRWTVLSHPLRWGFRALAFLSDLRGGDDKAVLNSRADFTKNYGRNSFQHVVS